MIHQNEAKAQPHEASNLSTIRTQSLAMSTMPTSPAPLVPYKNPSQENPLFPEWIHAITTLMGHPLSSEPGKYIQEWILYHAVHDLTDFWLSWDPTDDDVIRLFQKYSENDGSVTYLPGSTDNDLINLWNYMNLLINQDRPADQKYNKLYHVIDEQWTKLTVGSHQVPFLMCTLETLQKYCSTSSLLLNFCLSLL